jgi:hypothetical protein
MNNGVNGCGKLVRFLFQCPAVTESTTDCDFLLAGAMTDHINVDMEDLDLSGIEPFDSDLGEARETLRATVGSKARATFGSKARTAPSAPTSAKLTSWLDSADIEWVGDEPSKTDSETKIPTIAPLTAATHEGPASAAAPASAHLKSTATAVVAATAVMPSLSTILLEQSARAAETSRVEASSKKARSVLDIVVTHFEEPLDWLCEAANHARRVFVYHKGDPNKKLTDYLQKPIKWVDGVVWTVSENVGREGATILTHCLEMRRGRIADCLPDHHTLFLQGNIEDHRPMVYPFAQWHRYIEQDYASVWGEWYARAGHVEHNDRYKRELSEGTMQPTKLTFAEYYTLLTGRPFPPSGRVYISYCNVFSVSNRRIMAHAESFYERALMTLTVGKNPAVGHLFERLTRAIFGGSTPACGTPFLPILA